MDDTYVKLSEVDVLAIWPGVVARAVEGDRLTLAVVDLEPDADVAEHHHDNEQLGVVLKGEIKFTIKGARRTLHAGEAYVIPSNAAHSAQAGSEGATVVDVFAPVRADWESKQRLPAAAGNWP